MKGDLDKNGWQDGSKAPKTGEQFLADIGLPWAVVAMYNEANNEFVYAEFGFSWYAGRSDPYFITEYEKGENIKRWQPLPEI